MCLYGQDLDEDTTPIEAGLMWVIGKRRSARTRFPLTLKAECINAGKDRRESGDFIGAEGVRKHLKDGPPRRRVGLTVDGAPARREWLLHLFVNNFMLTFRLLPRCSCRGGEDLRAIRRRTDWYVASLCLYRRAHAHISTPEGTVTSGIPSPSLGKNIAMAYVKSGWHKKGTAVEVDVRNKLRNAVLTPMPFVPTKYYRSS